jgi:hypothetical protein
MWRRTTIDLDLLLKVQRVERGVRSSRILRLGKKRDRHRLLLPKEATRTGAVSKGIIMRVVSKRQVVRAIPKIVLPRLREKRATKAIIAIEALAIAKVRKR